MDETEFLLDPPTPKRDGLLPPYWVLPTGPGGAEEAREINRRLQRIRELEALEAKIKAEAERRRAEKSQERRNEDQLVRQKRVGLAQVIRLTVRYANRECVDHQMLKLADEIEAGKWV